MIITTVSQLSLFEIIGDKDRLVTTCLFVCQSTEKDLQSVTNSVSCNHPALEHYQRGVCDDAIPGSLLNPQHSYIPPFCPFFSSPSSSSPPPFTPPSSSSSSSSFFVQGRHISEKAEKHWYDRCNVFSESIKGGVLQCWLSLTLLLASAEGYLEGRRYQEDGKRLARLAVLESRGNSSLKKDMKYTHWKVTLEMSFFYGTQDPSTV